MMRKFVNYIFLLFCCSNLFCQTIDDSLNFIKNHDIITKLSKEGQLKKKRDFLDINRSFYQDYKTKWPAFYIYYGNSYSQSGDYNNALKYYDSAILVSTTNESKNLRYYYKALSDKGTTYLYKNKVDSALSCFMKAKTIIDSIESNSLKYQLIVNLYYAKSSMGISFNEALEIDGLISEMEKTKKFNYLAHLYYIKSKYLFEQKKHAQSFKDLKKSIKFTNKKRLLASNYNAMAIRYEQLDQHDSSIHYNLNALTYSNPSTYLRMHIYTGLGGSYLSKNDQQNSYHYYKLAETEKNNILKVNPTIDLKVQNKFQLYGWAYYYKTFQQFDTALIYIEKAKEAFFNNYSQTKEMTYDDIKDKSHYQLIDLLNLEAELFESMDFNSKSLKVYRLSIKLANKFYDEGINTSTFLEMYHDAINGFLRLSNEEEIQFGWNELEKFKYRDINTKMSIQKIANNLLSENDRLLFEEKIGLKNYYLNIINSIKQDSVNKKEEYDELVKKFKIVNNEIDSVKNKFNIKEKTLSNINVKLYLSDNEALINYLVDDSTLIYLVSSNSSQHRIVRKIETTKLSESINSFNSYSINNSYYLYKTLFPPEVIKLLKNKNHLYIIPDGKLHKVPFEALLTEKPKEGTSYKDLPYLIKKYSISYGYSATLLFKSNEFRTKPKEKLLTYGGFAPEYDTDLLAKAEELEQFSEFRSNPGALANNKNEVGKIAKLFKGDQFLASNANEKNFKNNASKYKILHLAMHALTDEEDPLYSKFLFTNRESDTSEDNYLNAYELYNMQLNADLAVLSACNTGYGKVEKGEGAMSLARAFKYAGCPSVVMSLWQANDKSSEQIMTSFFEYLKEGHTKSQALRLAKLDYLETADNITANPMFWSNFVVLGDDSTIEIEKSNWWVYLIAGTGLFVFIFIFWRVIKKRKAVA